MEIAIHFNAASGLQGLRRLRRQAPRAVARALNRAAGSARTAMTRAVAPDMGLPQKVVRPAITVVKATPQRLASRVEARGARIPLITFRARGPEPSRGRGRGVRARMPGGAGHYPHAFIATMPSGHRGVFQRVGRSRLAIRELKGPSVVHVFRKHLAVGIARGREALITNLRSEFRFAARS